VVFMTVTHYGSGILDPGKVQHAHDARGNVISCPGRHVRAGFGPLGLW